MNNNCIKVISILILQFSLINTTFSQNINNKSPGSDSKDMFDIFSDIINKKINLDSLAVQSSEYNGSPKSIIISFLPSINYSPVTKWAFGGLLGTSYSLNKSGRTNMSTTDLLVIYTLREQLITKVKSVIWSSENKYHFAGDWRFMKYPSYTFGLGANASFKNRTLIDYNYLRIHQAIYRELSRRLYYGIGYKLDYHYNVKEISRTFISDFANYNVGNQERTIASGPTLNLLYDSRENLTNPKGGSSYAYLSYRYNSKITGSSNEWQSLIIDARKYIKLPLNSSNILALWSYNWLTFAGDPAYLDLPSTGWDSGDSQGRGYIQGRFRSNNLISFESEYRFAITRNKVLGGVVFTNVQSYSNIKTADFEKAYPAAGLGIRLKINKLTNTNLSVDFAAGLNGSKTLFFNIGEIF